MGKRWLAWGAWGVERINFILLGAVIVVATFWLTDRVVVSSLPAPVLPTEPLAVAPGGPRVFVYVIDSLRYETAMDATMMPELAKLRRDGVAAKVSNGYNAVTGVGLRDAFTGRENTSLLASISNFIHVDAKVESLFSQLALAGHPTAVFAKGDFVQFGAAIAAQSNVPLRVPPARIDAHMRAAFARFLAGGDSVVIGHLTYTDDSAHANTPLKPLYRGDFMRADALIGEFRRQLPAGAHFVVISDHGHDEAGRHGLGMNVPSACVYSGPTFQAGVDLGAIPITGHRYLMSQIFNLSLPERGYEGGYYPEALRRPGPNAAAPAEVKRADRGVMPVAFWLYASLLVVLWLNLACRVWSPLDFSGAQAGLLWIAAAPLAWLGPLQPVLGSAAAVGVAFWLGRRAGVGAGLRWVGLPVLAGLFFHAWGRWQVAIMPVLMQVTAGQLAIFWSVLAVVGMVAVRPQNRSRWTLGLLVVAGLLFWPTHKPVGFPGLVAPLLGCWFLWLATDWVRAGRVDRGDWWRLGGAGLLLMVFLQTIAGIDELNRTFNGWTPLVPGLARENLGWITCVGFLAKAVVFFPRWPNRRELLLGGAMIVGLYYLEWRVWEPGNAAWVALLAGAGLMAWITARGRGPEADRWVIGAWFLLMIYFLAPSRYGGDRAMFTAMMAALVIGARLVARRPDAPTVRADYAFLAIMGLMVTGWASLKWSVQFIEWERAYAWFSPPFVQQQAGWFIPWIVLKAIVPFWLIRHLLRRELAGAGTFPAAAVLAALAVKATTLLMVNTGLGADGTLHPAYHTCAEIIGVAIILFPGLLLIPGSWPRREIDGRRAP